MIFGHTRLLVSNFAECFRFYREVFGFRVIWGDENSQHTSFIDREGTDANLALFEREPQSFADWGIRSAYLRDPDGNLIELHSGLQRAEWSDELVEASRRYKPE